VRLENFRWYKRISAPIVPQDDMGVRLVLKPKNVQEYAIKERTQAPPPKSAPSAPLERSGGLSDSVVMD